MTSLLRRAARVIRQAVSVLAVLLLLILVGSSIAAYLTMTGRSLALLRLAMAGVGHVVTGQRTERISVDVVLNPADGGFAARATLQVQSVDAARQRFYFLLNDGLRARHASVDNGVAAAHAVSIYQLWLLTIVDVGTPVPQGGSAQLTLEYDGRPTHGVLATVAAVLEPQRVLLPADAFWYPTDLRSFFAADVTVTAPRSLTVVHNGVHAEQFERGALHVVRWTTERPVPGLALVAGQFASATSAADGTTYRLYLPPDTPLDTARLLGAMRDAHGALRDRYGDSGFHQITLFVDRALGRDFSDRSGLIGLPMRDLRTGDYGFAAIAHNLAHNWWGGTVAGSPLAPATGSAWLEDGLAEFSSMVATEATYGAEALWRRRGEALFDPNSTVELAQLSALDDALGGATAQETIRHKGAFVALMLRRQLGDQPVFDGLRQFIERFRYQRVGARDLQQVLQETSQQDLQRFFADWVDGAAGVDLSLDGKSAAEITVANLGSALLAGDVDLWTFKRTGGEPARTTARVGDRLPLDGEADHAVIDPLLVWADGYRDNNRYPRESVPLFVAASPRGDLAITSGERFPWARTTVIHRGPDAKTLHTWDFARGLLAAPVWSPDGSRLVASYAEAPEASPAIITLAATGTQRTIGHGTAPAIGPDGTIYAAQHERIVRFSADGIESVLVRRRGESLDRPLPAPDGARLAYTATRMTGTDLRLINRDGNGDRLLLSWDPERLQYTWSTDGTHLYAVVGGTWDWQVWDVPVDGGSVTTLASGAAGIAALALSPDGNALAFTAAPELDYPGTRHHLFVLRVSDRTVRTIDLAGFDLGALTWTDAGSLVVVATPAAAGDRWLLPATRVLKRVDLADGSVTDLW